MSVVVKGMKMPENCWECVETDLNIAISVFGGMCPFCEKIRTDHDMQTGRHPECPLGALPDTHGRLIDANKCEGYFWEHLDDNGMAAAMNAINDMPTIEPQRKKGRWIKKTIKKKIENDYSCSECGRHVSVMRGYDVRMVYPFCHCGAEMTEGEG